MICCCRQPSMGYRKFQIGSRFQLSWRRNSSSLQNNTDDGGLGIIPVSSNVRCHLIFGANTDVGKSVVSTGLVRASLQSNIHRKDHISRYIKPLQCGGNDADFVRRHSQSDFGATDSMFEKRLETHTIFKWNTPASPHLASMIENQPRSDMEVLQALRRLLTMDTRQSCDTLIETAGGVLSPSAASPLNSHIRHAIFKNPTTVASRGSASSETDQYGWSTQGDLYQQLRLPVILVGDGRLGGISATLSALESLIIRGFDIHGIVFIQDNATNNNNHTEYSNHSAVREYVSRKLKLRSGLGHALFEDPEKSIISLPSLPPLNQSLNQWFHLNETREKFESFDDLLKERWNQYIQQVDSMRTVGKDILWWPFTQHAKYKESNLHPVKMKDITLIDGAYGDYFHVIETHEEKQGHRKDLFDACASWWTQGIGHGDSTLALTAAAAAGRYGHVIFPDVVHSPAVTLSKLLLGPKGPGYQWANRVFFSDDGSTAMEIALKMGLRKFCQDRDIDFLQSNTAYSNLTVCAQQGCYHGDTLGTMNVAQPNIFNRGQQPWYEAKGLFLDFPIVRFRQGYLEIALPDGTSSNDYKTVLDIYDIEARLSTKTYHDYILSIQHYWKEYELQASSLIGSVILEPLLVGAGGMKFVDPLWQRALVDVAREMGVPVIFDEVASGLFRMGARSCREILKTNPDIAAYAKVLTGGVVPMSVTLASENIFSSFLGDSKSLALLHGHSYSAHPVGCALSIHALETYNHSLEMGKMTFFDESRTALLSKLLLVKECMSLGTVLALKIGADDVDSSHIVQTIVGSLRKRGYFARPLGDVIYIMTSFFTASDQYKNLLSTLEDVIVNEEKSIIKHRPLPLYSSPSVI